MKNFLDDFLVYEPEGDAAIWKNRADSFIAAISGALKAHPLYSKKDFDARYLAYILTDKNQFLKFYNEVMANYPFNAKSIILPEITGLITFMSAHDGLDSDAGIKMYYNAAIVVRDYIKEEVLPKTNAYFIDFSKTKEENLATFISLYDKEEEPVITDFFNISALVRKKTIAMVDSIISLLMDYGEMEDKKDAMLFCCDYDFYIKEYHKALALFFANEENQKLLEEQIYGEKRNVSAETISKMTNFLTLVDYSGKGDYRDIFTGVSKGVINTLLSAKRD